jgi:hypothetical protein
MSDLREGLRLTFRPLAITALFLGESPPTWDVLLHARQPALSQDEGILRSGLELSTGVPGHRLLS